MQYEIGCGGENGFVLNFLRTHGYLRYIWMFSL